jgi:hypothetical protein
MFAVIEGLVPTAGCNEVDPSGLLLGVPRLRGTVIFRVGLLKKHLCVREVEWSNITAKRWKHRNPPSRIAILVEVF